MNEGQKKFAQEIYKQAQEIAKAYPVNALVMTAQACLESAFGTSGLAKKGNNLFGIKAQRGYLGQRVCMKTTEYLSGKKIKVDAYFRAYSSQTDSLKDYAKLISTSRYYTEARKNCADVEGYIQGLKSYATDPKYLPKLRKLCGDLREVV